MGEVSGRWNPRFDALAEALADEVAAGEELGASIAVDVDGELVADMWAGHADRAKTVDWQQDTIVNFWSCTKTLTALAALMLVDRGELDPFSPVARYWPEFAANGKASIEVRHLLSHTSGVSGWQTPFGVEDIYDWATATAHLAAQAPWWPPGTASGYHAMNYGHLIGELVRRITGTTLKDFVAEQIAAPLSADVQIGARPEDASRIAELVAPHRATAAWASCRPTTRRSGRSRRSRPARTAWPTPRPTRGDGPTSAAPTATATPAGWSVR